jgi:hypothetical protein
MTATELYQCGRRGVHHEIGQEDSERGAAAVGARLQESVGQPKRALLDHEV